MSDIAYSSIHDLARSIRAREISSVEIVQEYLRRLQAFDGTLRTHITIVAEAALDAAEAADRDIAAGRDRGPLHGIPVSHKDNCWTKGVRTTAHSKTLLDFVPAESATFVARLERAGMILLGKTNTTEFACGDMDEFGYTPNPWSLDKYTGASSSGSAGAIAAGLSVAASGTDTGGSTRAPASMCGIVGVKATYGRVSRHGVEPLSWTMDHPGPMTRSVRDAAVMLEAMAGFDLADVGTAQRPGSEVSYSPIESLDGVRIGVPNQHFFEDLAPDVDRAVARALQDLESLGAELRDVDLPSAGDLEPVASILTMAEAYALHAERIRTHGREYGPKARTRISAGAFYSSADYLEALQLRGLWKHELERALVHVDVLVVPTLPTTACTIEAWRTNTPDTSWGTRHFNLSGHPAMTIPCGFDSSGLPIGLQIVANAFGESTMFQVGHAYEQATEWHTRRPNLKGVAA